MSVVILYFELSRPFLFLIVTIHILSYYFQRWLRLVTHRKVLIYLITTLRSDQRVDLIEMLFIVIIIARILHRATMSLFEAVRFYNHMQILICMLCFELIYQANKLHVQLLPKLSCFR